MVSNSMHFFFTYLAIFVVQSACVHTSTPTNPSFQSGSLQAEPSPIQSVLDQNLTESPDVVSGIFKFDNNNPFTGNINDLFSKFNSPFSGNADPELEKMCKSTDYLNLCLNTLSPVLNGKNDIDSVITSAIKVAADYTKVAVSIAEKLMSDKSMSEKLASTISDCKDSYNDALDNFQEALSALPGKDVGKMNSMLSAAITDFSDVNDFLAGIKSPLLDYDDNLVKLTSNCLAITSLINPAPPPM